MQATKKKDETRLPSEILTVAEAANYLKVHRNTVLARVKDGTIPGRKIGKVYRFRRETLAAFVP